MARGGNFSENHPATGKHSVNAMAKRFNNTVRGRVGRARALERLLSGFRFTQ